MHRNNYDIKPSYSNYPTDWYANKLLNNLAFLQMIAKTAPANFSPTIDFLRANVLLLNVFYDKMGYVATIDNPTMTFDILIATFGGNIGLFLGITVLSFVEFIEIIFYMIYFNVKRIVKK